LEAIMAAPVVDKLTLLSAAADFDLCATCAATSQVTAGEVLAHSITRLFLPNGRTLSVLKVLMTDACHYDCFYCANRSERRCRRHSFTPDELASSFMHLRDCGLVNGLFLSSGIHSRADETMRDMLTAVEIVRKQHRFPGYIHLKILPGAPYDCVAEAVELADRVSVNMEAPTQSALDRLGTRKRLAEDIIQRMHWIRQAAARAGQDKLKSGQTTQFVVGPAGESDREVLASVSALRRSVGLRRAYFSAFRPVSDTPLEGETPTPPMRQHRLYQAEWLLREYGFNLADIPFDDEGRLPLGLDPKVGFAVRSLHLFPIEVNGASRAELMRVPGIGPKSASRIIAARRGGRITSLGELRRMGVTIRRAAPFVLCAGRRMGHISDLLREKAGARAARRARAAEGAPDQLELALS
jgi:putative DNA modification/repair radical SAM protein